MKFIHLADLHLGIRIKEYSMLDEQRYILDRILDIVDNRSPDGVIIAGDIYDKSIPSAEAVELFDDFLVKLAARSLKVFVISGNHDSPERIAFGARLMDASGIYMSPVYKGSVEPVVMSDGEGEVNIYLLPFIKPANVRAFFPGEQISSYTDALRTAVEHMDIDESARNILVTHQFVTGAKRSESENISVGGADNVDISVFKSFDYVALGHLHCAQSIGNAHYAGAPLKYSFGEALNEKSVTLVELNGKNKPKLEAIPLKPQRDMVEIKGSYQELTKKSFYENTNYKNDFVHITLTDELDVPDAMQKLRTIYQNAMRLDYDNALTRHSASLESVRILENKAPLELFSEFYLHEHNQPLSAEQTGLMSGLIKSVWEENR